jgi:ABC-type branched-subunit amino acid transport system substrate-binding protein
LIGGLAVVVVGSITLAACGTSSSGSGGSYDVQIVSSLTGNGSSSGLPSADGAQAAFDAVNAQGGINGHKIDFQTSDDQSSATQAGTVGRAALSRDPVAIIDGSYSSFLQPRMAAYGTAKVPVFASNATTSLEPWLYSVAPTSQQSAVLLASGGKAAVGSLTGKKVAIVVLASPAGVGEANAMKALVQQDGGTVADVEQDPAGAPSFASGAAKIVASHADLTMVFDSSADVIVVAKALITANFKGPIVTYFAAADSSTFKTMNTSQFYAVRLVKEADPGTQMYNTAKQYKLTGGTTNQYFGVGWSLAYLVVAGLQKCGYPCSASSLITALDSLGSFNVPGDVQFAGYSVSSSLHNVLTAATLYRWDPSSSQAVSSGSPIPVGSPDYQSS